MRVQDTDSNPQEQDSYESYAKIMTRLAQGDGALLAVGTVSNRYVRVCKEKRKTQEGTTEKKKITGFADLSTTRKRFV